MKLLWFHKMIEVWRDGRGVVRRVKEPASLWVRSTGGTSSVCEVRHLHTNLALVGANVVRLHGDQLFDFPHPATHQQHVGDLYRLLVGAARRDS